MTHDELVNRAVKWLLNTKRCSVVIRELSASETPDAIGWYGMWATCLIEAKVSISDFKADAKKVFRLDESRGMGLQRFYLVPDDLKDKIFPLLPKKWGLLSCRKATIEIVKKSDVFENNWRHETHLLISALRRISDSQNPVQDVSVKFYAGLANRGKIFVDVTNEGM